MAKVTGPLFSVDARGKIADTLVYQGWRGIKTARRWLKPSNPKTANQMITRGHFSDAVELYHGLTAADKAALRLTASGQPYSGFNVWVGGVKGSLDNDFTWVTIRGVQLTEDEGVFTVAGIASEDINLRLLFGGTPALLDGDVDDIAVTAGAFSQDISPAGGRFYFKLVVSDTTAHQGFTGIYSSEGGALTEGVEEPAGEDWPYVFDGPDYTGDTFDYITHGTAHSDIFLISQNDFYAMHLRRYDPDDAERSGVLDTWIQGDEYEAYLYSAHFTPDGRHIVASYGGIPTGPGIALLDHTTPGTLVEMHAGTIQPGPFQTILSPDGNHIVASADDREDVKLYRVGDTGFDLADTYSFSMMTYVYSNAFSPCGNYVAVGTNVSPFFTLLDRSNANALVLGNTYTAPGTVRGIAFSPCGNYIAISHANSPHLTILDHSTPGEVSELTTYNIGGVAVHLSWSAGKYLTVTGFGHPGGFKSFTLDGSDELVPFVDDSEGFTWPEVRSAQGLYWDGPIFALSQQHPENEAHLVRPVGAGTEAKDFEIIETWAISNYGLYWVGWIPPAT